MNINSQITQSTVNIFMYLYAHGLQNEYKLKKLQQSLRGVRNGLRKSLLSKTMNWRVLLLELVMLESKAVEFSCDVKGQTRFGAENRSRPRWAKRWAGRQLMKLHQQQRWRKLNPSFRHS